MEIIDSKVEFWKQNDTLAHIARCARVCYASDNNDNNVRMCNNLWNNKHRSMFRHAGVYYIIPEKIQLPKEAYIGTTVKLIGTNYYVSANEESARKYWSRYRNYRISMLDAENNEVFYKNKMLRYTMCIDTGIDITREYNRKSPNNIAEQSTRYVDFNKKLGIRFKKCHWMNRCNLYQRFLYKFMAKIDEWFYKISRSKYGLNLLPQDARWCLFLDVMSRVVYTYTVAEWEYIINMREFDWTGKAHPDAKIVAKLIHEELNQLGYDIEDYTKHKEEDEYTGTPI